MVKILDTCNDMSSEKCMKWTVGQLKEYLKQRLISMANYNKAQMPKKAFQAWALNLEVDATLEEESKEIIKS